MTASRTETDLTSDATGFLRERLSTLKQAGLTRKLRELKGEPGPKVCWDGRQVLLLCSNNYLGLAADERLKQASLQAVENYGCGSDLRSL